MAEESTIARALTLGGRLLAEQCETGDPVTHEAVEQAVEVLAQRLSLDAENLVAGRADRGRLPRLVLPEHPGPPLPPRRGTDAACHAMAARLRGICRDLPRVPEDARRTAAAVERLARALEEHAIGLEGLARRWPEEADGPRLRRAEQAMTRLQRILLTECHAVLSEAAG